MLGRELHFILGLWHSSIFSNSSSACHSHISPLHPLCLLSYPLSHCLSHSCTHLANMCTDTWHTYMRYFIFSYTKTYLPLTNDALMCCLHQCILAAPMCPNSFQHLLLFFSLAGWGGEICPSDTINIWNRPGKNPPSPFTKTVLAQTHFSLVWNLLSIS